MFAFSQTTSYALLALSCLARDAGSWHLIGKISSCIGVAPPYLAKVLHTLAGVGLVETKRGYKGGYRLASAPEAISLLDVAQALDERHAPERCLLGLAQCSDERACPAHEFWKVTRGEILARLASLTLVDLARFEEFGRLTCRPAEVVGSAARMREQEAQK